MNDSVMHPLEAILRMCAGATPNPWYPSLYVQATGTPREQLDPLLDQLRMGGLIRLTDWVEGTGQGYVLTPGGAEVLDNPRYLNRLRAGDLARRLASPPADLRRRQGTAWDRGEAAREALLGRSAPVVTYALIAINVFVFLAGYWLASARGVSTSDYLSGTDKTGEVAHIQELTGALRGRDIYLRGQWWRLLTACFGHIGLAHLATNMISLFLVGPLLERIWGPGRFLLLYLLAGFGGSCGMLIENPAGGGAGASGALWGVLASLATWLFLNRHILPPSFIAHGGRQLLVVFALNVFITFGFANISKGGHFGGGIVGLLVAVPLDYLRFGSLRQRLLALGSLIAVPIVCLVAVLVSFRHSGEKIAHSDLAYQYEFVYVRATEYYNTHALPFLNPAAGPANPANLPSTIEALARKRTELASMVESLENVGVFKDASYERDRQNWLAEVRGFLIRLERAQIKLQRLASKSS
jgi:membrane associated rhomboid family serine protease